MGEEKMICKFFKKRSKDLKPYFWCSEKRQQVTWGCYENCNLTQPRAKKPIRKISKKRKTVSENTYNIVRSRDNGICQLCALGFNVELHHIKYRSEAKDLIDEPNNCIMLCADCHRMVHKNKHKWQPILQKIVEEKCQI